MGYGKNWNDIRNMAPFKAKEKNIDDVGFIKALIERLFSARIENETFQQRIVAGASLSSNQLNA